MLLVRKTIVVGPFQCNCSILLDSVSKEAGLIDAGDDFAAIKKDLLTEGYTVKWSFHTHAHLDHIGAVTDLKRALPSTKILLHRDDAWLYENLPMQGQMFGISYERPPAPDEFLEEGHGLTLGAHKLRVIHTPGHSPGGVCLHSDSSDSFEKPFLFSGDTLFRESIGRTDLWGADGKLLTQSIQKKLFTLDEVTEVLPGHGPLTTIGHEMRQNPFVGHGSH